MNLYEMKLDATNEITTGTYSNQCGAFAMAMIKQPKKVCKVKK